MNTPTIIVLIAVAAAVGIALWILFRNKGGGCGSCNGDCSRCNRK